MTGEITFSMREVKRIKVLQQLISGQITNQQAADQLGLVIRQVQRLKKAYREHGGIAIVHKLKGKPSGRGYSTEFKQKLIDLYQQEYSGWNFSHYNDSLEDEHNIRVSDHYIYTILTSAGIKSPRAKKHKPRKHPPRARRENAGELLQTDASIHVWIVLDSKKYALHGMIDDATSIVTALMLCDSETNYGYQLAMRDTIKRYGIPECLYTDFRTVFQTNKKLSPEEKLEGKELEATRFAKMCKHLGVEIISTSSPQAKGRIERLWETLQDRLTRELKKAGITTKKEANDYINDVFLPRYNARFASTIDCNRNHFVKVQKDFDYNQELALPITRTVLHGCYIKLNNQTYIIKQPNGDYTNFHIGTKITAYTCLDGTHYAEYADRRYILNPATLPKRQNATTPRKTPAELSQIRSECAKKNLNSPWRRQYAHA